MDTTIVILFREQTIGAPRTNVPVLVPNVDSSYALQSTNERISQANPIPIKAHYKRFQMANQEIPSNVEFEESAVSAFLLDRDFIMAAQNDSYAESGEPQQHSSGASIVSGEGNCATVADAARFGTSALASATNDDPQLWQHGMYGGYFHHREPETMDTTARVSEHASSAAAGGGDPFDDAFVDEPQQPVAIHPSQGKHLRMQSLLSERVHGLDPSSETEDDAYEPEHHNNPAVPYNDADVLLGRGGLTNRHPGNQEYLIKKTEMQHRYLKASKQEKTRISQELVDWVYNQGGRFMKVVDDEWVEIDNAAARKKASQALREINTSETRARKRARYK